MPGLQRRSPLKGLSGRTFAGSSQPPLVMLSRSEASLGFPIKTVGKREGDSSLRLGIKGVSVQNNWPALPQFSPFSGLRRWSPGIYPRAGPGRRPARGTTSRSPCEPPATTGSGHVIPPLGGLRAASRPSARQRRSPERAAGERRSIGTSSTLARVADRRVGSTPSPDRCHRSPKLRAHKNPGESFSPGFCFALSGGCG